MGHRILSLFLNNQCVANIEKYSMNTAVLCRHSNSDLGLQRGVRKLYYFDGDSGTREQCHAIRNCAVDVPFLKTYIGGEPC